MLLNDIKNALETLNLPVYYGMAQTMDGEDLWDYIVFFRTGVSPSETKRSMADAFTVALVQENYVDDGKLSDLMKALRAIPGVSIQQSGVSYEYMMKPGTNTVLEAALVPFVKPFKACNRG